MKILVGWLSEFECRRLVVEGKGKRVERSFSLLPGVLVSRRMKEVLHFWNVDWKAGAKDVGSHSPAGRSLGSLVHQPNGD